MADRSPAQDLAAEVLRLERENPPGPDVEGNMDVDPETWSRMLGLGLALAVLGPRGVAELGAGGRR